MPHEAASGGIISWWSGHIRDIGRKLALALALCIPPLRRLHRQRNDLVRERDAVQARLDAVLTGPAGTGNTHQSPFWFYNSAFDAVGLMKKYQATDVRPKVGHLANYLGVYTDTRFFPGILTGREGEVNAGLPVPANWHTDIAEWGAALRAVDLSGPTFTVMELGCGWGCWINNAGAAARRAGKSVTLIGVEGEPAYATFAREACLTNGFQPEEFMIVHGVAGRRKGMALFPTQQVEGASWGLEPVFNASEQQRREATARGSHVEVPMLPLADLIPPGGRLDLLHMDIQGGEADFIEDCLPELNSTVACLVIGTHSREIEGRLFTTLSAAGWIPEIERPCIFTLDSKKPVTIVDGLQGWRNPALLP
ncbi:hypothetical protein AOE01nite_05570 [Acetobacter oeni]|uniref:Methyltransferase FkbM domain-containing protein n=2 Tax=Acetobacter oeni TaxID=304077 RepID=A0A511XHA9_9PROT|nr:class I SAM-dependent methyltransferase [Acetobacter oeni]GEN62333.1 hypothetical protein AOE01nite_05570 [Acetobacter oeni]